MTYARRFATNFKENCQTSRQTSRQHSRQVITVFGLGERVLPWQDVTSRYRCASPFAPLAQSAERFHGKEKVVSSILTGGSNNLFQTWGREACMGSGL